HGGGGPLGGVHTPPGEEVLAANLPALELGGVEGATYDGCDSTALGARLGGLERPAGGAGSVAGQLVAAPVEALVDVGLGELGGLDLAALSGEQPGPVGDIGRHPEDRGSG